MTEREVLQTELSQARLDLDRAQTKWSLYQKNEKVLDEAMAVVPSPVWGTLFIVALVQVMDQVPHEVWTASLEHAKEVAMEKMKEGAS